MTVLLKFGFEACGFGSVRAIGLIDPGLVFLSFWLPGSCEADAVPGIIILGYVCARLGLGNSGLEGVDT